MQWQPTDDERSDPSEKAHEVEDDQTEGGITRRKRREREISIGKTRPQGGKNLLPVGI